MTDKGLHRFRIAGKTLSVPEGRFEVGRMHDCWLTLADDLVSRYHARFYVSDGGVQVEDLQSRNGTYVNGRRIAGRVDIQHGDEIKIGNEIINVLGNEEQVRRRGRSVTSDMANRQTVGGEQTQFPSLIGQLVEKSLNMGKVREAERYALALTNQLMGTPVPSDHPTASSCVDCLIALARKVESGVWIDRVFKLHAVQGWLMEERRIDAIRTILDAVPRIPGTGLGDYEQTLRALVRDGKPVPNYLMKTVAELSDVYRNT